MHLNMDETALFVCLFACLEYKITQISLLFIRPSIMGTASGVIISLKLNCLKRINVYIFQF